MFFDPMYWILIGPCILLAMWAQFKVKNAYQKWSRRANLSGLSGAEAAAEMLSREGVFDVHIEQVQGWLSDHYDPSKKTLRLSPEVYSGRSVASLGIACHEAGHALQHAHGYAFLGMRSWLVPTANLGSWLAFPLIIIGLILGSAGGFFIQAGIILFAAVVAFQLITLPVEFNASSRAKAALVNDGMISNSTEIDGVKQVLDAAAMTYVAAALSAIANLVYFILLAGRRD